MATDLVQITYDQMATILARWNQLHEIQVTLESNIRTAYDPMKTDWQGKGAGAFFNVMESQIFPSIKRLQQALSTANDITTQIIQLFQQAEAEAAQLFKGSDIGGDGSSSQSSVATPSPGEGGPSVKDQIRDALKGTGYDEKALENILANATPEQMQQIWQDPALMNELHNELGTDKYLDLAVRIRMNHSGTVAHTTAGDADKAIRDHLADYVKNAVANGKQITGKVAIVDDTNWDIAGINRYGKAVWEGGKRDSINGFVDQEGRVWIHKDKGNPGTMIHEATHKYSDPAMIHVSQPLNEGVTEYFTRSTTNDLGLPERGNYQENYEFVSSLSKVVGEDVVADAYFNGNMDGLKSAYIKAGFTESQWNTMIEHTRNNEWADAELLTVH